VYNEDMRRLFLFLLAAALVLPVSVLAQDAPFEGVAEYLPVDGQPADGDFVVHDGAFFRLSREPYEDGLYGVINIEPALAIKTRTSDGFPVVTNGTVSVNVSNRGGSIDPGDFITSSDLPGVGMRANDPGVVLGRALEPFASDNSDEVGQVAVALNIHFAVITDDTGSTPRTIGSQVRRALVTGAAEAVSNPNTALRYALAAAVIVISLILGLVIFGRSATNGVTAVGRNPLAKRTILLAISFNIGMTVLFVAGGVAAAFFILAL
jgi:hypothetical protein